LPAAVNVFKKQKKPRSPPASPFSAHRRARFQPNSPKPYRNPSAAGIRCELALSSTSPDPPSTGPPAAGRGAPDVDSRRGATGGRIDVVEPLVAGSTPWSRRVRIHPRRGRIRPRRGRSAAVAVAGGGSRRRHAAVARWRMGRRDNLRPREPPQRAVLPPREPRHGAALHPCEQRHRAALCPREQRHRTALRPCEPRHHGREERRRRRER